MSTFDTAEAHTYDFIQHVRGRSYRREAEFVIDLLGDLRPQGTRTVLDLACGTGGHLPYWSEHFQVEGLDFSEAMLEIARRKAPSTRLHRGDLTTFDLGKTFDAVLCLFSSIAYARTPACFELAVANIARHLEPEGVAIVEPWFSREEYQAGTTHAALVDQPDVKIARMNVSTLEDELSVVTFHYMVARGTRVQTFTERHEMGLFDRRDYLRAFDAAGLSLEYRQGGPSGRGLYVGRRR